MQRHSLSLKHRNEGSLTKFAVCMEVVELHLYKKVVNMSDF